MPRLLCLLFAATFTLTPLGESSSYASANLTGADLSILNQSPWKLPPVHAKRHQQKMPQRQAENNKAAAQVLPPQPIVPSGIISADGTVRPIVFQAPITSSGILSMPMPAAIHHPPMNPAAGDVELARLRLTRFLHYEYPAQLRDLDSQIAVTEAEVAALQRRLANYSRFDKFINDANPLFESQQLAGVALVDAQQRLLHLRFERARVQQWLPVELRKRQLEFSREREAMRLLPGGDVVPATPYEATFGDDQER